MPLAAGAVAVLVGAVLAVLGRPDAAPPPVRPFDVPDPVPRGPSSTPAMSAEDMAPGTIFIPSLQVYAPIEPVGVVGGALQVPRDPGVVGWDDESPGLAADAGSTFLAGHVQVRGQRGALHALPQVAAGSRIFTRDETGVLRTWVVSSLHESRRKVMAPEYFATTGERRLTLVTCTGPVVRSNGLRSFRDAAVVTAIPLPQA
ncbi:hypothetical protein GCM10009710_03810 [Aeromicrobium alkaliterrae]|uniref:Sortase n=1 Tax=Aeromicrobium alkaliterrae TaxID=302168 RepID=A0ABP4VK62_9ACTN